MLPPLLPRRPQNLSPEVDEQMLFERFLRYGDIYQVRVDSDDYGRSSGMVSRRRGACSSVEGARWYRARCLHCSVQVKQSAGARPPTVSGPPRCPLA